MSGLVTINVGSVPAHLKALTVQGQNALLVSSPRAVLKIAKGDISIQSALGPALVHRLEEHRDFIDIIVLNVAPRTGRRRYAEAYDPKSEARPETVCWSDNGEAPNASVKSPPTKACAVCPFNALSGDRTCAIGHKIVCYVLGDPEFELFEMELGHASLNVVSETATKLNTRGQPGEPNNYGPLKAFQKQLGPDGVMAHYVLRAMPNTGKDPGGVCFAPVGYTPAAYVPVIQGSNPDAYADSLLINPYEDGSRGGVARDVKAQRTVVENVMPEPAAEAPAVGYTRARPVAAQQPAPPTAASKQDVGYSRGAVGNQVAAKDVALDDSDEDDLTFDPQ